MATSRSGRVWAVLRARSIRLLRYPESGAAAIELTLLTPLFVLLLMLIVALGRATDAHIQVEDAAHAAARASTREASPSAARVAAASAAADSLSHAGVTCRSFDVDAVIGTLAPGSTVRVRVSCTVGLADVAGVKLPGASTQSASFTSVVDWYRNSAGAGTVEGGGS